MVHKAPAEESEDSDEFQEADTGDDDGSEMYFQYNSAINTANPC